MYHSRLRNFPMIPSLVLYNWILYLFWRQNQCRFTAGEPGERAAAEHSVPTTQNDGHYITIKVVIPTQNDLFLLKIGNFRYIQPFLPIRTLGPKLKMMAAYIASSLRECHSPARLWPIRCQTTYWGGRRVTRDHFCQIWEISKNK